MSVNGRTRHRAVLPAKIEEAYRESENKRGVNKTSRLDYASGYADGYQAALDDVSGAMVVVRRNLRQGLRAP